LNKSNWLAVCFLLIRLMRAGTIAEFGRRSTEKGDRVSFHAWDVFLPDAAALPDAWGDAGEMEGTIVDFSDSGADSRVFAVVEVLERRTVVVPVMALQSKNSVR
jgi:hypothetical protein